MATLDLQDDPGDPIIRGAIDSIDSVNPTADGRLSVTLTMSPQTVIVSEAAIPWAGWSARAALDAIRNPAALAAAQLAPKGAPDGARSVRT